MGCGSSQAVGEKQREMIILVADADGKRKKRYGDILRSLPDSPYEVTLLASEMKAIETLAFRESKGYKAWEGEGNDTGPIADLVLFDTSSNDMLKSPTFKELLASAKFREVPICLMSFKKDISRQYDDLIKLSRRKKHITFHDNQKGGECGAELLAERVAFMVNDNVKKRAATGKANRAALFILTCGTGPAIIDPGFEAMSAKGTTVGGTGAKSIVTDSSHEHMPLQRSDTRPTPSTIEAEQPDPHHDKKDKKKDKKEDEKDKKSSKKDKKKKKKKKGKDSDDSSDEGDSKKDKKKKKKDKKKEKKKKKKSSKNRGSSRRLSLDSVSDVTSAPSVSRSHAGNGSDSDLSDGGDGGHEMEMRTVYGDERSPRRHSGGSQAGRSVHSRGGQSNGGGARMNGGMNGGMDGVGMDGGMHDPHMLHPDDIVLSPQQQSQYHQHPPPPPQSQPGLPANLIPLFEADGSYYRGEGMPYDEQGVPYTGEQIIHQEGFQYGLLDEDAAALDPQLLAVNDLPPDAPPPEDEEPLFTAEGLPWEGMGPGYTAAELDGGVAGALARRPTLRDLKRREGEKHHSSGRHHKSPHNGKRHTSSSSRRKRNNRAYCRRC